MVSEVCEAMYWRQREPIKTNITRLKPTSRESSRVGAFIEAMSISRNLNVNGRQNSLSSVYSSSMESLSSSHGADFDQESLQELTTSYTIPRLRTKTSDYDTSAAEYDEDKKHSKKSARVRKVRTIQ